MRSGELHAGQGGFTYLFLLFLVALGGVLLAAAGQLWSTESRREKESELLFVGEQFRLAIESYRSLQVAGQGKGDGSNAYPRQLAELLEDRRVSPAVHHLRRIYVDPLLGTINWGLIRQGDGIVGVYSLAPGKPLKQRNFPPSQEGFTDKDSYRDWVFAVDGGAMGQTPRSAPVAGEPAAQGGESAVQSVAPSALPEAAPPNVAVDDIPQQVPDAPPPVDSARAARCSLAFSRAQRACVTLGAGDACMARAYASRLACLGGG